VPLTHRDHAHGVLFVTGHARGDGAGPAIDWPSIAGAAAGGITVVVYMGIASAPSLQAGLLSRLCADTPVAIVQDATLPQQRQAICRLAELAAVVARERLGAPAIIVIGDVVRAAAAVARREDASAPARAA
jgi:uroporphyrin-III C-methyltransferase